MTIFHLPSLPPSDAQTPLKCRRRVTMLATVVYLLKSHSVILNSSHQMLDTQTVRGRQFSLWRYT